MCGLDSEMVLFAALTVWMEGLNRLHQAAPRLVSIYSQLNVFLEMPSLK